MISGKTTVYSRRFNKGFNSISYIHTPAESRMPQQPKCYDNNEDEDTRPHVNSVNGDDHLNSDKCILGLFIYNINFEMST